VSGGPAENGQPATKSYKVKKSTKIFGEELACRRDYSRRASKDEDGNTQAKSFCSARILLPNEDTELLVIIETRRGRAKAKERMSDLPLLLRVSS